MACCEVHAGQATAAAQPAGSFELGSTFTLVKAVDEALVAADDGCCWWAWIATQIRASGKPYRELDRDRVWLDLHTKHDTRPRGTIWDVHAITVLLGTLHYRWPCATLHVIAHASEFLIHAEDQ